MSSFFLLNNLHFSLEIFGALAFLIIGWLALDSFLVRKDITTASRGIGFAFLAAWQIIHAFNISSDIWSYIGYGAYIAGILFVLLNFALETPTKRPEFKAIIIIPGLSALIVPFNTIVTFGLFLITFFAFSQYKKELKKALLLFWIGFLLLSLGALTSLFYTPHSLSLLWTLGHVFELLGFIALGLWVWSYLQLRVKEEIALVFISMTFIMAIVVSLTFASILVNRIETETRANLLTNVRVLDFTIERLKEEALAKAKLFSLSDELERAVVENNFVLIDTIAKRFLEDEKIGFLSILGGDGGVILRAHAPTQRREDLSGELAVSHALFGEAFVSIEKSPVENLSIRAASPIFNEEKLVGVVLLGFPLDNILADNIKKITGLEMSIFERDVRVATTLFNPDGLTRSIGIKQTDSRVLEGVLEKGNALTLRTTFLSQPFIASYVPLTDAEGSVVGMLAASKPQTEIFKTAQATNRLTLIVVILVMFILIMPIYGITKKLSSELH